MSLRRAFTEHLDLHGIGTTWRWLWSPALERTRAFRRDRPEVKHRFLDLPYDGMTTDPVATVRRIHERFGLPFTWQALAGMHGCLAAPPNQKRRTHRYRPEDYGLSPAQV